MENEANATWIRGIVQELHDHIMLTDQWDNWGNGDTYWWIRERTERLKGLIGQQRNTLVEQLTVYAMKNLFEY